MICGVRLFDFKQKEVINIANGCRLGYVSDIEIDEKNGCILKIIIAAPGKIWGIFGCDREYVICWNDIKKIGSDIIIVDACDDILMDKRDRKL